MIVWREAMALGAPALDADNRKLVDLVNALQQAAKLDTASGLEGVFDDLSGFFQAHFQREEAVLAAVRFPDLEAHRKMHADLAAGIGLLCRKFRDGDEAERRTCTGLLARLLNEWLINHVIREDLKLKPLLPKKPAAMPVPPPPGLDLPAAPVGTGRRAVDAGRDVEYSLPPEFADLLKRLEFAVPDLPPPQGGFTDFVALCEAAVCRRLDRVMVFFQRHNPAIRRELPPVFLAAPEFAEKFRKAVARFVLPAIAGSRQVRNLATSIDWASLDSDTFWRHVTPQIHSSIMGNWQAAWDALRLVPVVKGDGTRIWQVKDATKELRVLLEPSSPESYDLPKVGNREIETFASLLDPASDWWEKLNRIWQTCVDLYEQEKDPRVFQQKARDGALRDGLLNTFNRAPERWVDFLVLSCHRVFPRISTQFLETFTHNLGRNEADREKILPYTIRYLRQARERPEIRRREMMEEAEWRERMQRLRDFLAGRVDVPARDAV